jgi:hypothetical protein
MATMPRRVYSLPQIRGMGRHKVGMGYCSWDPLALRMEQLNDKDIGPILEDVEARQLPEWKDIAHHSPAYKSCCAQ